MATDFLVDSQVDDGSRLLAELVRANFDVTVALWTKTKDEGLWFLYISSPSVDASNLATKYREIYASFSRVADTSISISQIKLIDTSNPIAKDAIALRDRYPAPLVTRFQGKRLGDLSVEEAVIYPSLGPMSRSDVMRSVAALMSRTGILFPSTFTFRDGTSLVGYPKNIEIKSGDAYVTLRDHASAMDREVVADDIVSIY